MTLYASQSMAGQHPTSERGNVGEQCWALVAGQRRDLADAVADLPGVAWDTPSLCAGWRVRDVVAHVVGNAEGAFTARRALPALLAHRFNVAAWLYDDGRRRGAASPAELVARLRESAGNTFQPPGRKPADVLADVIIHGQDIFVPLGIDRHAGAAAVLAALVISVPQGPPLHTGRRAAGLRLRATDLDWQWGDGEEVTGTGEALLMALTGRAGLRLAALRSRRGHPGRALPGRRPASAPGHALTADRSRHPLTSPRARPARPERTSHERGEPGQAGRAGAGPAGRL